MIEVVDFKQEHLDQIVLKDIHQGEVPKLVTSYAVTFLYEKRPIAIIGAFFFTSHVLHIWAFISEEVRKCPLSFHKSCLSLLKFYQERYHSRRMQMDVRVGYEEGFRWAKSLGFKFEGVMSGYGSDGTDYALFGRVN